MNSPEMVTRVFDGAKAVVDCASSITNAAIGTYNMLDQLGNDQNQAGQQQSYLYSRRCFGNTIGTNQQQIPYQPTRYPWANDRYNQFYVGMAQAGYPGISNQDYGRRSFVNSYTATQQSGIFQPSQVPDVRAWANPWGR